MVLRKNEIPITFVRGVETGNQESLPVELLDVVNLRYTKVGGLEKRGGYDELRMPLGVTPRALLAINKEVLCVSSSALYTYSPNARSWLHVENASIRDAEESNFLLGNTEVFGKCVCHENSDFRLYAWERSGSLKISTVDIATGRVNPEIHEFTIDNAINPKIYNLNNILYLFWVDPTTNSLKSLYLQDTATTLLATPKTVVNGGVHVSALYDVNNHPTKWLPIFYKTTSNTVRVVYRDPFTGASPDVSVRLPPDLELPINPISVLKVGREAGDRRLFYILYNSSNSMLGSVVLSGRLEVVASRNNIMDYGTKHIRDFTFVEKEDKSTCIISLTDDTIHTFEFDVLTANRVSPNRLLYHKVRLASDVFKVSEADVWEFLVSYEADFSSFYVGVSVNATAGFVLSSRLLHLTGGGHLPSNNKLHQFYRGNGLLPYKARTLRGAGGSLSSVYGLKAVKIRDSASEVVSTTPQPNIITLSGSMPTVYDGLNYTELGFLHSPDNLTYTLNTSSPTKVPEGDYWYTAVYSYMDYQGNLYRSSPTQAVKVTVPSGGAAVNLTVDSISLSNKTNIRVEFYRTEKLGTVSYLIGEAANNIVTGVTSFVDIQEDGDIVANELLYTTGRIIQNDSPPSARYMENFQNRLWFVGEEALYYSKPLSQGVGIETSALFTVDLPHLGGKVKALKVMGDFLVVLRESSIGLVKGRGASVTGQGSNYDYDVISEDIGCVSTNSVVYFNKGIMFPSQKGIMVMDAGGNLNYVGLPVVDFERGSTFLCGGSKGNEIWFGYEHKTKGNGVLVYNTQLDVWTRFDFPLASLALDMGLLKDPVNAVVQFVDNKFSDGFGKPIQTKIQTGWLSFANVRGFQRIYELNLLGKLWETTTLLCSLSYDCRDSTHEVIYKELNNPSIYGTSSEDLFGQTTPFGGTHASCRVDIKPKKQKCDTISLTLESSDINPSKGFELSTLLISVGAKRGLAKPQSQDYKGNKNG